MRPPWNALVVAYGVDIGDAVRDVPAEVKTCLRDALHELAAVIAALPPGSTFLSLFQDELLRLDLMGWRFFYQVDLDRECLRVVTAYPER